MSSDKRKKGCPNERCEMHTKKVMQKSGIDYCPKCGTKSIFVCGKCFREIENIDKKHRICYLCEAELEEKRAQQIEKTKEYAGKAVKAVAAIVTPVVVEAASKAIKDGQKGAVKAGVKAVDGVVKAVLKK